MRKVNLEMVVKLLEDGTELAARARIGGRTAIRRLLGTASWQHDADRLAAAEAKRARRRARVGGSSS